MSKYIVLAALALGTSAFATGTPTPPTSVVVTGTATNTVQSATGASSYVLGAGSSKSSAVNTQTATAYVGGEGSFSSKPSNAFVTIGDCAPSQKVSGVLSQGSVSSFGGTTTTGDSKASNVSTGSGVGTAQALGVSYAAVEGSTTLSNSKMNLEAHGSAGSLVATDTGVVGTNGKGASSGSIASVYTANAAGSVFTYKNGNTVGDVKSVTGNSFTRVGGIPVVSGGCKSNCTIGSSVVNNAVVEGWSNAGTSGQITVTTSLPTKQ